MNKTGTGVMGAMLVALLMGCVQFPTTYDRVDADKVRLLDFIYGPAEAAPGDSVTLVAVFSGKAPDVDNIQWDVSYRVVRNVNGADTAFDIKPLSMQRFDTTFSKQTTAVGLRFRVPEDMLSTAVFDRKLLESLRASVGMDGGAAGALSTDSLLHFLDALARRAPLWRTVLARDPLLEDSLMRDDALYAQYRTIAPLLPLACQVLTAKMRLFATIPGSHRILSDYAVRYTSALAGLPGSELRVNTNPLIDSVGIYIVEGWGVQYFKPEAKTHRFTFKTIFRPDMADSPTVTIPIDSGFSYLLACFSHQQDSALTLDALGSGGGAVAEQLRTQWYFKLVEEEAAAADPYKFPSIFNNGNLIVPLYPSADTRISRATIWLELRDELLNELNRPQGSTLQEFSLGFTYSEAYKRVLKRRKG